MKPRGREDVVFRRVGEEFAILDPGTDLLHILNPTAAAVWVLCDGGHTLSEIASLLSEAFATSDAGAVQTDAQEAVASFREKGLLVS